MVVISEDGEREMHGDDGDAFTKWRGVRIRDSLWVDGLEVRVQGLGFRVYSLELRVKGSGFRVYGLEFRIKDLGFRVYGWE